MKHPGYSRASNQYAQRTPFKLSRKRKEELAETMKAFNARVKSLSA